MQRPVSSLSDASSSAATSASAGASAATRHRQRPQAVPGGPRKPSVRALPSIPSRTQIHPQAQPQPQQQQQPEQPEQERRQEHRQSKNDQPPSYLQSQHDLQTQSQRRSYTPPPTSAVTSDSSSSHPPMSLFTRADTPSSMSALSPVRTSSPALILEPLEERSPPRQASIPRIPLSLSSSSSSSSAPLSGPGSASQPTFRTSTPSVPSVSKPPTPAPESPVSGSAYSRQRMVTTLSTPAPLQPPPSIDFSSVPVPFKALTLDAAQWTFSSAELQAIVSRAIRASAEPSSIRLLPLQVIDDDLVQEAERLESERAQATAQYRFTMHRRNMLLQSLNASSGPSVSPSTSSANTINLSQNPPMSPAADLAQRLAEVSATLDRLAATLVRVSDQLAQIRTLRDVHSASALAVALRKLNASYARRTRELETAKEKLAATEEERDEAWRVAEEMAMEYDEELDDTAEVDVVNGERAVAVPATLTRASRVGMRIKVPGVGPRIQQRRLDAENRENGALLEDEEERGRRTETNKAAGDSPASAPGETTGETSATTPITRRKRANSATSRVTAARTRSVRASKASLRFPRRQHESRPPSTYSTHSTQSGPSRARSRSRANSISSLRDASPTSAHPHGAGANASIPDVPKMPTATELARLASVKSTSSTSTPTAPTTATVTLPPIPPPPPPPIETNLTKIGSFLDMITRPNSATDEKGKSPEKASPASGVVAAAGTARGEVVDSNEDENAGTGTGSTGSNVQEGETLKHSGDAQASGGAAGSTILDPDERVDAKGQGEEVDGDKPTPAPKDDEAQVITVPPRSDVHQAPFSASRVETSTNTSDFAEVAEAKKHLQVRPSLQVYPPTWTRPPPDSPVDVMRGSGPHRADNGDDDDVFDDENEDEDELADAFESAYARTQLQTATRGRFAYARSPLRVHHTQSMLPFPSSTNTTGINTNTSAGGYGSLNALGSGAHDDMMNVMKRSPVSDNQITMSSGSGSGPFRGYEASASTRRPTSLPSAQGEKKPWDYF